VTSGPRRSAKPGELNPQPEVPSAAPVANEMQWPEPALVGPSVVAAPNVAAGPGEVRGEPAGTVLPKPALPVPSLVGPALPVPANGSAALAAKSSAALPAQPKPGSGAASSATAAGSELQAELALIGFARDALSAGDYVQARAWARQHAQRFASGSLVVERQAIDALASCRADQGRELGAAFVARWSDSLFTPRVIRDCSLTNSVPSATMPGTDR
jgi:hypothetical protein